MMVYKRKISKWGKGRYVFWAWSHSLDVPNSTLGKMSSNPTDFTLSSFWFWWDCQEFLESHIQPACNRAWTLLEQDPITLYFITWSGKGHLGGWSFPFQVVLAESTQDPWFTQTQWYSHAVEYRHSTWMYWLFPSRRKAALTSSCR